MKIPKIIHLVWVGSPLPTPDLYWMERFTKTQPGWQIILHTDNASNQKHVTFADVREFNPKDLINADVVCAAEEKAPRRSLPAIISDVARVEFLVRWGGVYVDTDYYPIDSWDGVISEATLFASEEFGFDPITHNVIGNFILGSVPGHPALWNVLRESRYRMNNKLASLKEIYAVDETGPSVIRDVFSKYADATIFPFKIFSPWSGKFAPPVQMEDVKWHPSAVGAHVYMTRWTDRPVLNVTKGSTPTLPAWRDGSFYGDKSPWVKK